MEELKIDFLWSCIQIVNQSDQENNKYMLIIWFFWYIIVAEALHPLYWARIKQDLSLFHEGISPNMIQRAQKYPFTCKVVIKDHKLEQPHCFLIQAHEKLFRKLASDLPDLQFVINHIDEPRVLKKKCKPQEDWKICACDEGYQSEMAHGFFIRPVHSEPIHELVPIFSGGTISRCFADILMPSYYHLQFGSVQPKRISWNEKQFGAIWRGTSTGGMWGPDWPFFQNYHRQKLVSLCSFLKDCDAKFSDYFNCSPEICSLMQQIYGPPSFVPMQVQFRRKIIIDIDGNTFSRRFPFYLLSSSAVFKIAVFQDIGTIIAKEWKHYVPVKIDLSDLEEKIEWARSHDEELRLIGRRGKKLARRQMGMTAYKCYMYNLLMEYHKLMVKGKRSLSAQQAN